VRPARQSRRSPQERHERHERHDERRGAARSPPPKSPEQLEYERQLQKYYIDKREYEEKLLPAYLASEETFARERRLARGGGGAGGGAASGGVAGSGERQQYERLRASARDVAGCAAQAPSRSGGPHDEGSLHELRARSPSTDARNPLVGGNGVAPSPSVVALQDIPLGSHTRPSSLADDAGLARGGAGALDA
jgi:hypothetical protein